MSTAAIAREGARLDLQVVQGEDFNKYLSYINPPYATGTAIDLTGFAFVMQFRPAEGETLTGTATVSIVSPATSGQVLINIPRATTLALAKGTYKYNIMYLDASSQKHEFVYGTLAVIGGLTLI